MVAQIQKYMFSPQKAIQLAAARSIYTIEQPTATLEETSAR